MKGFHKEFRWGDDDELGKLVVAAHRLSYFEEIRVCLHGFRFDSRKKLATNKLVIGECLAEEALQMVVGRFSDAKGMT